MGTGSKITYDGLNNFLKRMYGTSVLPTTFGMIGTGTTTPAVADREMETPCPKVAATTIDACDAITDWVESADATAVTTDTSTKKEGTASLNMGKDGVASVNAYYTKTLGGAADLLTDGPSLLIWVYVADSSTLAALETKSSSGITVELSDNAGAWTDYYTYKVGGSDAFYVGWNFVEIGTSWLTVPDSSTGVVTLSNVTDIKLAFKTTAAATTITHGNLKMDYWHSGFYRFTQVGTITYDLTNHTSSQRFDIAAGECNGNNLSEFINANAEQPKQIEGHDVFTADSKTSKDVFIMRAINSMGNA